MGKHSTIEWPPRYPDLTPLDYFLWGYLKDNVYATKPIDLGELRDHIVRQVDFITPKTRRNVLDNFYLRIGHCQTANGQQFEHLIN